MQNHYPQENSHLKLLAASILLGLWFLYSLRGAIGGELIMPSRPGPLILPGTAAWLATLFAPLWFVGEFFLHSRLIDMPSTRRRVLYGISLAAAIVSALSAALWFSHIKPMMGL